MYAFNLKPMWLKIYLLYNVWYYLFWALVKKDKDKLVNRSNIYAHRHLRASSSHTSLGRYSSLPSKDMSISSNAIFETNGGNENTIYEDRPPTPLPITVSSKNSKMDKGNEEQLHGKTYTMCTNASTVKLVVYINLLVTMFYMP